MSNPNNLLRPPVLNTNNPTNPVNVGQGQPVQPGQNGQQTTAMIASIVQSVLQTQFQDLIQATANLNQNFSNFTDQTIDAAHINNTSELDKIPDVVRCLRDFSGNPGEFNSWKKSVDRILQIYEPIQGSPKYYGILSVIRNKVIGNADAALESYNTPLNWKAISKCLTLHYADKRDIRTLEYQMISLVQGNQTVQEFYQQVYTHLSLILNKIGCMDLSNEPLQLFTQTYRDKALDTFVRGLKGDLSRLLGMKEPVDLPQALHLCLKLENQNFRSNYAHNSQNISNKILNQPPHIPTRNFQQRPQQAKPQFFPQLAHMPQPQVNTYQRYPSFERPNQNFYNQGSRSPHQSYFAPPRPFAPKPQPRPEPMDIDSSSRGVNYMNRPRPNNNYFGKRPPNTTFQAPANKIQRNFHLNSDYVPEGTYHQGYPIEKGQTNNCPETENPEYAQEYFQQIPEEATVYEDQRDQQLDVSDLHFLG